MKKNYGCFHLSPASDKRIYPLCASPLTLPAPIAFAPYNQKNKSIGYKRSSSARCRVKLGRETSGRATTSTITSNQPSQATWNPSNFLIDVKSFLAIKSVKAPSRKKPEFGAKTAAVKLKTSTNSGS